MIFPTNYDSAYEMDDQSATNTSRVHVSFWNCANLRTTRLEQCAAASKVSYDSPDDSKEHSVIQRLILSLSKAFPEAKSDGKRVGENVEEKDYDHDSRGSMTLLDYDQEYDSDCLEDDDDLLYHEEDLIEEESDSDCLEDDDDLLYYEEDLNPEQVGGKSHSDCLYEEEIHDRWLKSLRKLELSAKRGAQYM